MTDKPTCPECGGSGEVFRGDGPGIPSDRPCPRGCEPPEPTVKAVKVTVKGTALHPEIEGLPCEPETNPQHLSEIAGNLSPETEYPPLPDKPMLQDAYTETTKEPEAPERICVQFGSYEDHVTDPPGLSGSVEYVRADLAGKLTARDVWDAHTVLKKGDLERQIVELKEEVGREESVERIWKRSRLKSANETMRKQAHEDMLTIERLTRQRDNMVLELREQVKKANKARIDLIRAEGERKEREQEVYKKTRLAVEELQRQRIVKALEGLKGITFDGGLTEHINKDEAIKAVQDA